MYQQKTNYIMVIPYSGYSLKEATFRAKFFIPSDLNVNYDRIFGQGSYVSCACDINNRISIGKSNKTIFINIERDRIYDVKLVSDYVYIDGVFVEDIIGESGWDEKTYCNISGHGDRSSRIPIMLFQFWDADGNLQRDMIPCVRESDGEVGMFDMCGSICPLTDTPFYINAGTGGSFVAGPYV